MTDALHDDAELVAQVLSLADVFSGRAYNADPWSVSTEPTAALLRQAAERISALSAENARLRSALWSIGSMRYGLDASDSGEEAAKYWGDLCIEYRNIARAALNDKGSANG